MEIRRKLGLKDGDTVLWEMADGEVRLTTKAARIRRAQALLDRLLHHAETVRIEGKSYRSKDKVEL